MAVDFVARVAAAHRTPEELFRIDRSWAGFVGSVRRRYAVAGRTAVLRASRLPRRHPNPS